VVLSAISAQPLLGDRLLIHIDQIEISHSIPHG
jgi:hypothetical protein